MKRIAVLGSTGSIGTSCLDVIGAHPDRLSVVGLTANSRWQILADQYRRHRPRWAALSDPSLRTQVPQGAFGDGEVLFGPDAVGRIAAHPDVDLVVAGIVGAAGLHGTWAALESKKTVALANKETLVMAGELITELARKSGGQLLPVDSEHSALFQALKSGRPSEVARLVLTASGGPFKHLTPAELQQVTVAEALEHPTWSMGPKITIDSATMMNKALEIIEARWLFDLDVDQIEVVIHPQSIVHALVEFVDGSVMAQLSPPDMKLPIQYALTFPERADGISPRLDLSTKLALEFEPPDPERFPALQLGYEVARRGGTCGAVLNAANEAAVHRFLLGNLAFPDIVRCCREVLDAHHYDPTPTLDDLLDLDRWARKETERWTSSLSH